MLLLPHIVTNAELAYTKQYYRFVTEAQDSLHIAFFSLNTVCSCDISG